MHYQLGKKVCVFSGSEEECNKEFNSYSQELVCKISETTTIDDDS